jgi:hypothetical protein
MNIRRFATVAVWIGCVAGGGASAGAATSTVCASGCTYTNTQLQTALNNASPGDTILLEQNFTYVGQFTLPATTCSANNSSCYITLQTGVTSTGTVVSTSVFPAADVRIDATYSGQLAKLQPNAVNAPAIKTATPPAVTRWWKLRWLEFTPHSGAGGTLLQFGSDSGLVQTQKSEIPEHFIVEQCYIHGDPTNGQFRGISIHANDVTVKDNRIADIKSIGEGQAIWVNSAVGPFVIVNNYIEGGTENVLFGGSGGCCHPAATVLGSPAPTTTSARLSTVLDLEVGQGVTFDVGGVEEFTEIATINTSTGDVTFSPALSATPSVPGDVDWGVVPRNLTFALNHVIKPPAWEGQAWLQKNLFELKNLDTALIEGNIFEYSWKDGQDGYAILFTVANTGNSNDSTRVRNITFRKNIVRHTAGGFQITGRDVSTNNQPSAQTTGITITDNLFYDISSSWGASARTAYIGTRDMAAYRAGGHAMAPANVTFEHNTFDHTGGNTFLYFDLRTPNLVKHPVQNLIFRNNIVRKGGFGMFGVDCTQGNGCWTAYSAGTSSFTHQVIADASCGSYPGSNWCPTSAGLNAEWEDHAGADYRLKTTSAYYQAGTDSKDIGADVVAVQQLTAIAASGDNSGGAAGAPLFSDHFNDNSLNTALWSVGLITVPPDGSITVAETGGQLAIGPLKQNDSGNHYNGIFTVSTYSLLDAYAQVKAVTVPASSTSAGMLFSAAEDDQNHYRIFVAGGTLFFEKKVAGTKTTLGSVTFNATDHAYWRIRHDAVADAVVFETAPTAAGNWTTRQTAARQLALAAVYFELRAGTPGVQSAPPGTVVFDDFHAARSPLLADDFGDGTVDALKWNVNLITVPPDATIAVAESSGTLQIGPLKQSDSGNHYNGIVSVASYDVTDAYAQVNAVTIPATTTNAGMLFSMAEDDQNHYRMFVAAGTLFFEKKVAGTKTTLGSVAFSSANHAHWRIRHDPVGDDILFETAGGVGAPGTWTTQTTAPRELALTNVFFELRAGTPGVQSAAPGTVAFDNFVAGKNQ